MVFNDAEQYITILFDGVDCFPALPLNDPVRFHLATKVLVSLGPDALDETLVDLAQAGGVPTGQRSFPYSLLLVAKQPSEAIQTDATTQGRKTSSDLIDLQVK